MIKIEKVHKSYDGHVVIPELDLEIPEGRIIGLLGPNGAGKTTLLRMVMGVLKAERGSITLFGKYPPGHAEALRLIGYMPQQLALYEGLTVRENILFFGRLYGVPEKELRARTSEMLERVELAGREGSLARTLSGGMMRRAMLASALVHRPQLLILDEPTAGVDPLLRIQFWEWFTTIVQEGVSILITTHHLSEADHCHEVIFFREGILLERGEPKSLIKKYGAEDLEAAFVMATRSEVQHQGAKP